MKTAILIFILLFTVNLTFGQKSADPAYKIRASQSGVNVTFQGKRHWLNVSKHVDAAQVTSTELLFATEKEGFRYLVIDVSGASRDSDFDRQCGAGTESNLIWLKLNSAWKILDIESARYESCWSGIDPEGPFKITKKTLSMEFVNSRDDVSTKLSYNADEPEKGFRIAETALKNQ